jgi:hypothetical protein
LGIVGAKEARSVPLTQGRQQRLGAVLPGAQGNAGLRQQRHQIAVMNTVEIKGQQA